MLQIYRAMNILPITSYKFFLLGDLWLQMLFTLLLIASCNSLKLEVEKDANSVVAERQLQEIYKQTKHMKYGECWTQALEQLQVGCRRLTDEMQRRIAYAFARCHLKSSGRDIPLCEANQDVSECTNDRVLQDTAFNTYTEFFTHTQQICFHLQSQIWHEATEVTISKLADNSADVASSLEESSVIARQMVERQNLSLQNQKEMLQNEKLMRENMHKSVLDVQKSHEETKSIIREQRALFAEVFDRVATLQKTMLGEFTSIYTFGFYVGASILGYILTSTQRTASARIWIYALLTLNFIIEKIVVNRHLAPTLDEDFLPDASVLPETVYNDLWICRKIFSALALVSMIVCFIRYKDYGRMNNRLLNEIKWQNMELQNLLREQNVARLQNSNPHPTPPREQVPIVGTSVTITGIPTASEADDATEPFDIGNTMSETKLSNEISSISSYQSDADSTFVANNHSVHSSESSFSSYMTGDSFASNPLDSVPAMINSFARSSTPSRQSVSRRSSVSSTASFNEKLTQSVAETEGVIIGGHNLRRRRRTNFHDDFKSDETVEAFIKSVAKVTVRRKKLLRQEA